MFNMKFLSPLAITLSLCILPKLYVLQIFVIVAPPMDLCVYVCAFLTNFVTVVFVRFLFLQYHTDINSRVFDVLIHDCSTPLIASAFDIVAVAGGPLRATTLARLCTVDDGFLSVELINSIVDMAKISGIEVVFTKPHLAHSVSCCCHNCIVRDSHLDFNFVNLQWYFVFLKVPDVRIAAAVGILLYHFVSVIWTAMSSF
jgi:hypothetical protein